MDFAQVAVGVDVVGLSGPRRRTFLWCTYDRMGL